MQGDTIKPLDCTAPITREGSSLVLPKVRRVNSSQDKAKTKPKFDGLKQP